MQFSEIVAGRRSIKKYDPRHVITDAELKAIFERVILSPSSFNLQHGRFIVIRDKAVKAQLRKAAHDQEQVETASAVVVVAAKLTAYKDSTLIYADVPESVRKSIVPMINEFYANDPQMQRDEAIRSASLAAMTLMYAAYDLGYASGPLIGFDQIAVGNLIALDDEHIPVMLVVIGKETGEVRPRGPRHPVAEVVKLESSQGKGLI